jgi:hypothetical protein
VQLEKKRKALAILEQQIAGVQMDLSQTVDEATVVVERQEDVLQMSSQTILTEIVDVE